MPFFLRGSPRGRGTVRGVRGRGIQTAAIVIFVVLTGVWSGCGKGTTKPAPACTVSAPTECPSPSPHYQDVQGLFTRYCVDCHWGAEEGPWSLAEYALIADWADLVRRDLLDCSMPTEDAGVPHMSNGERVAILTWILCGYPE